MCVWESIPDTSVCRTVQVKPCRLAPGRSRGLLPRSLSMILSVDPKAPVSQAPCEVMCPESLLAAPDYVQHKPANLYQITGVIHFNASDQDSIQETTRQMKYMKGVYKSIKTRHPMRKSKKMPWGDLKILNQAKTLVKQGYNNAYPQK